MSETILPENEWKKTMNLSDEEAIKISNEKMFEQASSVVKQLIPIFGELLAKEAAQSPVNGQIIPNILVNFCGNVLFMQAKEIGLTREELAEVAANIYDGLQEGIQTYGK